MLPSTRRLGSKNRKTLFFILYFAQLAVMLHKLRGVSEVKIEKLCFSFCTSLNLQ